jgi:VanZ family protein
MTRIRPGILLIFWSLLILFATLYPGNRLQGFSGFSFLIRTDLLVHFILFAVFTFLFSLWMQGRCRISPNRKKILIIIASGIVFGCLTELLQSFLPVQREASWSDFMADIAGVLSGWAATTAYLKRFGNQAK